MIVTAIFIIVGTFIAGYMIGYWKGWDDGYWTPHPDSQGRL